MPLSIHVDMQLRREKRLKANTQAQDATSIRRVFRQNFHQIKLVKFAIGETRGWGPRKFTPVYHELRPDLP
jgi:hypothetical protein